MNERRYAFSWNLIGDISARKNMGATTRVEVYRLMQFTMRDILERRYGTDAADAVFREAGTLAGQEFFTQFLLDCKDFNVLIAKLQILLRDLGIGILRLETADLENGRLTISVGEDLDCSGLPELDHEFCAYDEGFLAGILGKFLGKPVSVKEVDCWCTGDRTCRFDARIG